MNEQIEFWLNTGEAWTDRNASDVDIDGRAKTFKKLISPLPVKSILEVGCNKGYNLMAISRIGNYELTGIDILSYAIENTDCTANLIVANGYNLPFEDNSFDLVLACGYFDCFPRKQIPGLIKEVCRVTKRYILVIDYCAYRLEEKIDIAITYTTMPYNDTYWVREYKGLFPGFFCISHIEKPSKELEGWDGWPGAPRFAWWLFEKESELIVGGVKQIFTELGIINET